jgi:hypothetical protein
VSRDRALAPLPAALLFDELGLDLDAVGEGEATGATGAATGLGCDADTNSGERKCVGAWE